MTQWYTAYPTARPANFPISNPFPNARAFNRRMDRFFLCSGSSSADVPTPTETADSGTSTYWNCKTVANIILSDRIQHSKMSLTSRLTQRECAWFDSRPDTRYNVPRFPKCCHFLSDEYQENIVRNHVRFLQHPSNSSFRNSQLHVAGHYTHASALDEES